MRISASGATGVIGRRVVGQLVAEGGAVTAVAGHDAVVNLDPHIPTGNDMMLRRAWRRNDRRRTTADLGRLLEVLAGVKPRDGPQRADCHGMMLSVPDDMLSSLSPGRGKRGEVVDEELAASVEQLG